jgi:geranyl-CoA carboxylase alpha subunit
VIARAAATAVAAARAITYEGAGTLEFLLDPDGRFFFMEMNTRLQVEHPVTEAITGLDLVELQLRVASGEPLPIEQDAITFDGHAIECRVCAENAELGFVPQSGVMVRWDVPSGVRTEHALEHGARVSPYYDSMLAKIVSHGSTREDARRRLVAALEEAVAFGVRTNHAFLAACLEHPEFVAGRATTSFIGRYGDELTPTDPVRNDRAHRLAAVLLSAPAPSEESAPLHDGHVIGHPLPIQFRFETDSAPCVASVVRHGPGRYEVTIGDRTAEFTIETLGRDEVTFEADGLVERAAYSRRPRELFLHLRGRAYHVVDTSHAAAVRQVGSGGDGRVRSSMAGRVVAVSVAAGTEVSARQPLLTVEAMKMEHALVAPIGGRVLTVGVNLGDQVTAGQILVEIDPVSIQSPANATVAASTSAPSLSKERA